MKIDVTTLPDGTAGISTTAITDVIGVKLPIDFIEGTLKVPHHTKVKAGTYWRLSQLPDILTKLAQHACEKAASAERLMKQAGSGL